MDELVMQKLPQVESSIKSYLKNKDTYRGVCFIQNVSF